jgi:DNA-binding NarL/FixJ family response regulator
MKCSVAIVDDHPHARLALRQLLEGDTRFEVVGEAKHGEEMLARFHVWQPDLVLMDLHLPGMNGVQATKEIKRLNPNVKIIVVSVSDDAADLYHALLAGAQGYLIKNVSTELWLRYICAVVFEDENLPEQFTRKLVQSFQTIQENTVQTDGINLLTEREREIVTYVAKGLTNREIATQLFLSEHTVKNHLKNIMQKLHVSNRVQLAAIGLRITRTSH